MIDVIKLDDEAARWDSALLCSGTRRAVGTTGGGNAVALLAEMPAVSSARSARIWSNSSPPIEGIPSEAMTW